MRKPNWLAAAVVTVALVLPACGSSDSNTTVVGVVVDYQGDLLRVDSFVVRTASGAEIELRPAQNGDFAFPLPHLREHMTTADPVEVTFIGEGDSMMAIAVSDAD